MTLASDQIKFKILVPHKLECFALKAVKSNTWTTCWAFLETVTYRRKDGLSGGIRGGTRWWDMRCNDSQCLARATVCEGDLLEQLPNV